MATQNLNSLLKYRFTKKVKPKLESSSTEASTNSSQSSDLVTNGDSQSPSGMGSPVKTTPALSAVPDTPESQRPGRQSPVFPGTKARAKSTNRASPPSSSIGSATSASSSPWLTTSKPAQNGFSSLKTSRNRIMSDSDSEEETTNKESQVSIVEHQNRLRHLQAMFPTQCAEVLQDAVLSTKTLDEAIDRAIDMANKKVSKPRKRIRQISLGSSDSDSGVQPNKPKKARPLQSSQSMSSTIDLVDDDEDAIVQAEVDRREGLNEKVDFLAGAFPKVPRESLEEVLRSNNYVVEKASNDITHGKVSLPRSDGTVVSPSANAGSIKAIQAARAQARFSHSASNHHTQNVVDVNDDDDVEIISKPKKRERGAVANVGNLSDVDEDDLDDDYDSDDSTSEMMSYDQNKIMSFFNSGTIEELQSMPGCSKKKAELIMEMRPFDSWKQLVQQFEECKTLSFNLITGCREMIRIRAAVLKLMQKCEKISQEMQQIVSELIQGSTLEEGQGHITEQPKMLIEEMRLKPFQMVGLNWLMLMHRQDLNGILADEMGLGKTVQSISFLAQLTQDGEEGPHIVICPSSTLDNWLSEMKRWCPELKVSMYYGSQEERRELRAAMLDGSDDCQVLVTTYNMATGSSEDRAFLKKMHFHYAIFDEAHMLKNMSSLRYQNLMKIRSDRRILLTGTPLQNNLVELMSLLCFVMPEMFIGKTEHLKKLFSTITQKPKSKETRSSYEQETIKRAKNIMKPFVLRRLKAEVLQQLPKKLDTLEHCVMIPAQQELYAELKERFQHNMQLDEELRDKSIPNGAGMLMQLRKAANHPLLHRKLYANEKLRKMAKLIMREPVYENANVDYIYEDMEVMSDFELHKLCNNFKSISSFKLDTDTITNTGKFKKLDEMLPDLKEKGARVLLFSQFTMMLDIIEDYMKARSYKYCRLDGQTAVVNRQEMINKYNEDTSIFVFLLSTRAGGLGINLTSANTVILHDIDFNPYNDKQAEDRCHRVGQTRDVSIYRLISKNTVEEAIFKCAESKLKLEQDITAKPSKSKKDEAEDDPEEVDQGDVAHLLKEALLI